VSIDYGKCVGCGDCVKSCAYGVLEIIGNIVYPVKLETVKDAKTAHMNVKQRQ